MLTGCSNQKTRLNANIHAAEIVVIKSYEDEKGVEISVEDSNDIESLKAACKVLGIYEDGGYNHSEIEIIFSNSENEIAVLPAIERCDYMLTSGGTWYRIGMDRRDDLCEVLKKYGVELE